MRDDYGAIHECVKVHKMGVREQFSAARVCDKTLGWDIRVLQNNSVGQNCVRKKFCLLIRDISTAKIHTRHSTGMTVNLNNWYGFFHSFSDSNCWHLSY